MFAILIFEQVQCGCVQDILSLAGMLSIYDIFVNCRSATSKQQRDMSHQEFAIERGDHCTLINILREYENSSDRENFAAQHCLSVRALIRARHVRRDLRRHMHKVFPSQVQKTVTDRQRNDEPIGEIEDILKCVLSGFFRNVGK